MGDWYVDRQGKWTYDKNAPSPDPAVTQIGTMPPVVPGVAETFQDVTGATYGRVEPRVFASYDAVDSRHVRTEGAPR